MRLLPRSASWLLPVSLLGSAGCEGGLFGEADQSGAEIEHLHEGAGASPERYGLIILSRHAGEPGVSVSAQLLEYNGITRAEALTAVVPAEQAWLLHTTTPEGALAHEGADLDEEPRCRPALVSPPPLGEEGAWIDLLDVGTLAVSMAGVSYRPPLAVMPRDLPAVLPELTGVVYDADAPQALPYHPAADYRVEAPGRVGGELGGLRGRIGAASAVSIEHLEHGEGGLVIQISGEEGATALLSRDDGRRTLGLRCTLPQGGRHLLTESQLGELPVGELKLTVARARRAPLEIEGMTTADVVFISSDVAHLTLRAGAGD